MSARGLSNVEEMSLCTLQAPILSRKAELEKTVKRLHAHVDAATIRQERNRLHLEFIDACWEMIDLTHDYWRIRGFRTALCIDRRSADHTYQAGWAQQAGKQALGAPTGRRVSRR